MSESIEEKKPNPQEKLREIIRGEVDLALEQKEAKPVKKRERDHATTIIWSGVVVFALTGAFCMALAAMQVKNQNSDTHTPTAKAAFKEMISKPVLMQEEHPLEFIVGANAALMVYTDRKTESAELTKAIEMFSKRRDHDIGEAMGAVPNEQSGKLLDREAMLEAFELSIGYLTEGVEVKAFGLLSSEKQPLSKDTSIREERLINKIQNTIAGVNNPEAMVGQVKKLNAMWTDSEYYGEEDGNQARANYKIMSERILRRLDNTQG